MLGKREIAPPFHAAEEGVETAKVKGRGSHAGTLTTSTVT